jgi:hypothetical protein
MPLTKAFRDTVQARVQRDPAFRDALLTEAVEALLEGDIGTGKAVLRDYINATVGFEELGSAVGTPPKSLMRMFGPTGNPNARNLFNVIGHLQRRSGLQLEVRARR